MTDATAAGETIPVFRPALDAGEMAAAVAALEMGWLGMGSYVRAFEQGLADLLELDGRHVCAVSTGHAALHLSMLVAGVGPGDEVITPAFNNIADFQAILAVGAEPVLCDVLDETLCLDVEAAAELVGPATKAIIAMDYGRSLADHAAVEALASAHGLRVVHDAAHSLGSRSGGRPLGSFSDVAMFSFDPVKTITTIDGGAVVVRSERELEHLRELRIMGMKQPATALYANQRGWTYDVERVGFRYHLSNPHAAIGIAQLERMTAIAASRREVCALYDGGLDDVEEVRLPAGAPDDVVPLLYCVRVPADRRDELRRHLDARGVDTGIHWQPGHWFTLLRGARRGPLPVTDRAGGEILSLPLHPFMPPDWPHRVIDGVRTFFGR